jgi:hypothetical protein
VIVVNVFPEPGGGTLPHDRLRPSNRNVFRSVFREVGGSASWAATVGLGDCPVRLWCKRAVATALPEIVSVAGRSPRVEVVDGAKTRRKESCWADAMVAGKAGTRSTLRVPRTALNTSSPALASISGVPAAGASGPGPASGIRHLPAKQARPPPQLA